MVTSSFLYQEIGRADDLRAHLRLSEQPADSADELAFEVDVSQRVSPSAAGDPDRGDRVDDSEDAGEQLFPSFPAPRRRSEQAIDAVVMEAYVNGVSTREVDRLVEQLGSEG